MTSYCAYFFGKNRCLEKEILKGSVPATGFVIWVLRTISLVAVISVCLRCFLRKCVQTHGDGEQTPALRAAHRMQAFCCRCCCCSEKQTRVRGAPPSGCGSPRTLALPPTWPFSYPHCPLTLPCVRNHTLPGFSSRQVSFARCFEKRTV